MKKALFLFFALATLSLHVLAGGIVTNTNQSAAFARLMARNASLGIDAVYFNPAGLTKLQKGLFLSINNQSIFQTNTVTSNYPFLHGAPEAEYTGKVSAPFFPGIYAAYRFGKFAVSFGFNPIGGGGSAEYDKGVPSFAIPISDLVPALRPSAGVTDYKVDISFEGTSVYFGYQAGLSYEISPEVSVYAGVRYVTVKNTYKGSIRNIMINPASGGGLFIQADAFGNDMAQYYTGVATSYNTAATGASNLAAAGLGDVTFAQAAAAGYITPEQQASFEQALQGAEQPIETPIGQAQVVFTTVAGNATAGAAQMTGLAAQTGDKEVDVVQKGHGFTPIIAANLTFQEKLTLSLRYEFLTVIDVENDTKVDGTGEFPDKEKSGSDLPAMLAVGASYPVTEKLRAYADFNYYWDKNAYYGKSDTLTFEKDNPTNSSIIDKNFWEIGVGLQYDISEKILVSAGYLYSKDGTNQFYQSDLSYSTSSNAVGFGGAWKITPKIDLNIGAMFAFYKDGSTNLGHILDATYIPVTTTYGKFTQAYAIGLDFKFGK
ncbi:MAG: outer membrane beta-barrel protein [Bacteroidetes bacterium]|nr:outer membrane beta-barrel protein [Bacteroidota bacterium]